MSSNHDKHGGNAGTLVASVLEVTGASPLDCYQCGRCAAGCPQNVPGEMDISPTRIMHLLQMESMCTQEPEQAACYARQALTAETPWLCAGCQACTTRCPQGLDIAGTMDVLRQEGQRRGTTSQTSRVRDIQSLHKVFLSGILWHGRIHELFLVMAYKLRTFNLFQDATLAPTMFAKGKLHVLPGKSQDTERVRRAIARMKNS